MTDELREIITVSEMARMLRLSRARFYELMKVGVFPEPSRNPKTNRPFFNREKQEVCLKVRRTHCGINGKAVLFYGSPPARVSDNRDTSAKKVRKQGLRKQRSAEGDFMIQELRNGLRHLGVADISDAQVRTVLAETHPDGCSGENANDLLLSVFDHLNRRNSSDNVAQ